MMKRMLVLWIGLLWWQASGLAAGGTERWQVKVGTDPRANEITEQMILHPTVITDGTLYYTVLPMTDLRLRLGDLETLEPLDQGFVTINNDAGHWRQDSLHLQVLPMETVQIKAFHTLNYAGMSYERTIDANGFEDVDTTMLVSTYYALQEQNISPFRYQTFLQDGRTGLAFINGEWRMVLKKIDFTHASQGFENGGYTWWVGKANPQNGLQFTDQEQIIQEDIILTNINENIIHNWARPNSHRATVQDSSYFIPGYGTTRDGLFLVIKQI